MNQSERLIASWDHNAQAWATAVRGGHIPSRKAATDAAILNACLAIGQGPVLDVGCGEGWLARALTENGRRVEGIDASASLIDIARLGGGARFEMVSYDALITNATAITGPFGVIVCNFSILGDPIAPLLTALRQRLLPGGHLLIQTVHPWAVAGGGPYQCEWRLEKFDAFGIPFPAEMPWYFRTLESWLAEITRSYLVLTRLEEPVHPDTGRPLSVLMHLVAQPDSLPYTGP